MFKNRKKKEDQKHWFFLRLRICPTYLSIGCGGEDALALPVITGYVRDINEMALKAGDLKEPCRVEPDGGYVNIMGLDGFSLEAGWMMVGMLLRDGWFVQGYRYEELAGPQGGWGPTIKQPLIDMLWKDDFASTTRPGTSR